MSGYALAYRERWEHRLFKNKQEAAVWAWMCDVARWGAHTFQTRFGLVTLQRGQLLVSERTLGDDFGLHKNAIRRLIRLMSDDGMIDLNRDHAASRAGTIVTIRNYERYQSHDDTNSPSRDQGGTDKKTKAGPRRDQDGTTREYREYNEYKEDSPSDLSADSADSVQSTALTVIDHQPSVDEIGEAFAAYQACRREHVPGSRPLELSPDRRKRLAARLREAGGPAGWADVLSRIRGSSFLKGEGTRDGKFIPEIDWLLKPANLRKVLEGNYDDRTASTVRQQRNASTSPLDAIRIARARLGVGGSGVCE